MTVGGQWWCPTDECRAKQRKAGISLKAGKKDAGRWWFVPLPSQAQFALTEAPRVLWGGAAGPGKSFGVRRLLIKQCMEIPGLNCLLLRRTYPELERTHIKALRREAQELGFSWVESRKAAEFPNGSAIECGHMDDDAAVQKFLSTEYDRIVPEEGVQFLPDWLMELMSRARTSNPVVMATGGARVWIPTNPGGPGHALLRDLFISHTPDTERYPAMAQHYDPAKWAFIPARLDDNPYIDPDYEKLSLTGLRKARYEQLRHGDWDAAEGQFFEEFSSRTHARTVHIGRLDGVVEAVDWGFTSFGAVGWFAPLGDNHWHCIAEWKFRKLVAEDVAKGIVERRAELGIASVAYTVVDPSMKNKTGHGQGESFMETFARNGVPCRVGHNNREMGWPRLAAAFKIAPDGVPWLTFDPNCKYLLRSVPALLADKHNPEDVDSALDDHGADMLRYFVMSRPPLDRDVPAAAVEYPEGSHGWWQRHYYDGPETTGVLA